MCVCVCAPVKFQCSSKPRCFVAIVKPYAPVSAYCNNAVSFLNFANIFAGLGYADSTSGFSNLSKTLICKLFIFVIIALSLQLRSGLEILKYRKYILGCYNILILITEGVWLQTTLNTKTLG